ncbi:MAG: alpha/beta fold hydrolase [Acidobacteriota bacterium]
MAAEPKDKVPHEKQIQSQVESLLQRRPGLSGALEGVGPGIELLDPDRLARTAVDERELELAFKGFERIQQGEAPRPEEVPALEAIILPAERPVFDIHNDSFRANDPLWAHFGDAPIKDRLEAVIPGVGRIDVPNHPQIPFAGTGFHVGGGLLMTNRHVAEIFSSGLGQEGLSFRPGYEPELDLKQEVGGQSQAQPLTITDIVFIHPYWDCALLRVDGLAQRPALTLASAEPEELEFREIAIIGYPARSSFNPYHLQQRIFHNVFDRKRLQPGTITDYREISSYGNSVRALTHDASTLGGNSGSAVIDVNTGEVVALHFAGRYLDANFAVPAWELARDPVVQESGVQLSDPASDSGGDSPEGESQEPTWAHLWVQADPAPVIPPSGEDAKSDPESGTPSAVGPESSGTKSAPSEGVPDWEWVETRQDREIFEALLRDEAGTRGRLVRYLGAQQAEETIQDLQHAYGNALSVEESLFGSPDPDPSLPEILYLHGIMGGHLARRYGSGSRLWLNPLAFAGGNVAERLSLADDGETDQRSHLRIGADGHLSLAYRAARRRWQGKGFAVHSFSYDWRKSLNIAADQLAAFIEERAAAHSGRRFAIVAHSMGGLVAANYALRHPRWQDRVESAVLVGSPLGGSFSVVKALLGTHPTFRTLAKISRHDDVDDFGRLAQSLPGLLAMLPNPELFPSPQPLHSGQTWDHGFRPLQRWLTESLSLGRELLRSPLLPRTTGIVSRIHSTIDSAVLDSRGRITAGPKIGPGDDTVPLRAAAVEGLGALYESRGKRHAMQMTDRHIIRAVEDLLRDGHTDELEPLSLDSLELETAGQPALRETPELDLESPEATEAIEGLRRRIDEQTLRCQDLEWILDPEGAELPS